VNALGRLNELEVHVLACAPTVDRYTVIQRDAHTTFHYFPRQNGGYDTLLFYHGRRKYIQKLLDQIQPDLVHAQEPPAEILAGITSPYPHIVTVHGLFGKNYRVMAKTLTWRRHLAWGIQALIEAYNFRHLRHLIAITDEIAQIAQRTSPEVRVFRINNAIDDSYFDMPIAMSAEPVILFSGIVRYLKGVDVLLEAVRKVRVTIPEVQVRLAGSLDWEREYVARIRTRHADLLDTGLMKFLGPCSRSQMQSEYARCSLLCLPSRRDSAPMVIAEAMAAGKPVVATRVGGVPEMIEHGVTGRLCEPENAHELAVCLVEMLKNHEARRVMGERARWVAGLRYRADAVARATLEAYKQVLA
jgi:glycosyltransferase involved in cell wall biosynthesis